MGFVLGFCASLYLMIFMRQKKDEKNSKNDFQGISVFINFTIIDKDEAIQQGVEDKIGTKIGKGFLRDKIASAAGKVAARRVSDETVANKMGDKMSDLFPQKLSEMGILAEAKKVYGTGAFFVIKLTFLSIDLQKLLNKTAGAEKANMFEDVMNLLGGNWAKETLSDKMMPLVLAKLQEKLPEKMTEKMTEKGLLCDIVVKSENEEALYFFQQMNIETVE